jgi:hypothetical protein
MDSKRLSVERVESGPARASASRGSEPSTQVKKYVYAYNSNGQRRQMTEDSAVTNYTYNAANMLTSVSSAAGSYSYGRQPRLREHQAQRISYGSRDFLNTPWA